jgi:hypothetical protein
MPGPTASGVTVPKWLRLSYLGGTGTVWVWGVGVVSTRGTEGRALGFKLPDLQQTRGRGPCRHAHRYADLERYEQVLTVTPGIHVGAHVRHLEDQGVIRAVLDQIAGGEGPVEPIAGVGGCQVDGSGRCVGAKRVIHRPEL